MRAISTLTTDGIGTSIYKRWCFDQQFIGKHDTQNKDKLNCKHYKIAPCPSQNNSYIPWFKLIIENSSPTVNKYIAVCRTLVS